MITTRKDDDDEKKMEKKSSVPKTNILFIYLQIEN